MLMDTNIHSVVDNVLVCGEKHGSHMVGDAMVPILTEIGVTSLEVNKLIT